MNFIKDSLELASRINSRPSFFPDACQKAEGSIPEDFQKNGISWTSEKTDGPIPLLYLYILNRLTLLLKKGREGSPLHIKKPLPPDSTGVKKIQPTNKRLDTTDLSKTIAKKNSAKTTDAPDCSQTATESDTEALRSAILKANSEQEKIAVAAGAFAVKCFSVSQVRFLASLIGF